MNKVTQAVIDLGGEWPSKDKVELWLYKFTHGSYVVGIEGGVNPKPICTQEEFHSEAGRLLGVWRKDASLKSELDFKDWLKAYGEANAKPDAADESSWHERGEFPPIGEVVEYLHSDKWVKAMVVGRDGNSVWLKVEGGHETTYSKNRVRPIQSERDKMVSRAEMDIHEKHSTIIVRPHIQALIDAGWRPVKQQTEGEFVEINYRKLGGKVSARVAYQAGLRLVEVGDE